VKRSLRRGLVVLVGALLITLGSWVDPHSPDQDGYDSRPGITPAAGAAPLSVVSSRQLTARLREYVLSSAALGAPVTVRVQLPSSYDHSPTARRWPMALLLHGRSEDATTWSERAGLAQFDDMVIVTPDGGRVGWYTDWYDDSCCASPQRQRWESFHIGELLPWAERTFRLAPGRSQRFIAGDSMGGFGAMSYAARHPDLFGGAAELSGFVDLMLLETSGVVGVDGQSYQVAGVPPGSVFGPRATEEVRWRGRNPVDLADNLQHTDLVLRHGNGLPGQFGGSPDAGEAAIRLTGVSLHDRLTALGIDHVWDDYGNGVHTWPYWEWGMQLVWPRWLQLAAADAPAPEAFSYRSIDPSFSVYGWEIALEREVLEFGGLAVTSPTAFTLTGSGRGVVVTPEAFRPRGAYRVTAGESESTVRADSRGRLRIEVDLGPSHTAQQFTPVALSQQVVEGESYFATVSVRVEAVTDAAAPTSTSRQVTSAPRPAGAASSGARPATGGVEAAGVAGLLLVVGAGVLLRRRPVLC
jgi:S-formylglutathione hydrolase FrmB